MFTNGTELWESFLIPHRQDPVLTFFNDITLTIYNIALFYGMYFDFSRQKLHIMSRSEKTAYYKTLIVGLATIAIQTLLVLILL